MVYHHCDLVPSIPPFGGISSNPNGYGGTKGLGYPNGLVGGGNTNNHGATITVNLPGGFGKWVQLIRFLFKILLVEHTRSLGIQNMSEPPG